VTDNGAVVVIGGTSGIGMATAQHYADRGFDVVVTSRSAERADEAAATIGGNTRGVAMDLSQPEAIAARLADVGAVRYLVIAAIERDENTVRDYDVARATHLITLKLVGYTEVVHTLLPRMVEGGSIVLFGGLARDRPYPGSTNVTTVNGGVTGLVRTMAVELAPLRVNAIHPAVVGDTPYWQGKPDGVLDALISRTPIGRLITTDEIVDATRFLLENGAVNGTNLSVDGGWLLV
jgi:NAD(P)-dependent dehydrogenase (short-subunit alcohol dehydrogenase family)